MSFQGFHAKDVSSLKDTLVKESSWKVWFQSLLRLSQVLDKTFWNDWFDRYHLGWLLQEECLDFHLTIPAGCGSKSSVAIASHLNLNKTMNSDHFRGGFKSIYKVWSEFWILVQVHLYYNIPSGHNGLFWSWKFCQYTFWDWGAANRWKKARVVLLQCLAKFLNLAAQDTLKCKPFFRSN